MLLLTNLEVHMRKYLFWHGRRMDWTQWCPCALDVRTSTVFPYGLKSRLIMQVSISSITIPPLTPRDLHQKFAPTLGLLHQCFCVGGGGGDLLGQLLRGGHLSINNVCHFWNFHYNGKTWRLTTLWGLLVALKFYTFFKKIIQSQTEPKLKN